ncbi:protein CANDIDATE G-PROTEIN COUPLED RECEPTOR 2 [Lathyrus oleraceus]|uniref:Cullin-associated NEDD8-dissociated protein 2 n=1 Tax=Pisum sativum TaxID=3888 RepID=A0A9D5A8I0_PEA|nr:protein CANDIDATE G-PROTEIN COUPLED RECEPTOR 2-like [Pisum sativum]KAI5398438.1 Cullin-associated NEDD8-dissociated protein 2 [Pisum sativum]
MVEQSLLSITNQVSDSSTRVLSKGFTDWIFNCHGFWHNVVLLVASFLFVLYLALQARNSFLKLTNGRSYIIISYYVSLWLVSLLNLAWCFSQAWECSAGKELTWNLLSLFTSSGMLFLEVSLLAFLLQGNNASGVEALTRTFGISGIIVGFDVLLKAIYLFAFGVPLFIDTDYSTPRVKWNLWVIHKLLLTGVYGLILFMYHSRWRERLPARPAFYNYVIIMFILNAIALFACGLTGNGAGFAFWFYRITVVCYHAFYLPLLYITFLADFFQEEDFHMENVYYSEMKDAGFFESDWE